MGKGKAENLIKNSDLTPEERKEKASKAGKKSGEARAKKKLLKDELLALLDMEMEDPDSKKKVNTRNLISAKLIRECINGNVKAFVALRDTIGEKPVETINASIENDNKDILKAYLENVKK